MSLIGLRPRFLFILSVIFVFGSSESLPVRHHYSYCPSLQLSPSSTTSSRQRGRNMSSARPPDGEMMDTEEREGLQEATDHPVWDPVAQIYVGGKVPDENAKATQQMIQENGGALRLFGYGSLCWNPGTGILAHPSVTSVLGRARGYRRCWAQRSTDHRGRPRFPGIVCTLLKDEEFRAFRPSKTPQDEEEETLTEGLIYNVPAELVEECLAELDFREKGGYARDVISVIEDDSGETVQALLYRGTPDNPAFWPRVLQDLPFAAAIMAAAEGPSGENHVYLNRLDSFLEEATTHSPTELEKFDDTFALASMESTLRNNFQLHFPFGSGSNQHNQLLLRTPNNHAGLVNGGEDALEIKEMVFCTSNKDDPVANVFAGGGHSGLLTKRGRVYLFGWNENFQLGSSGEANESTAPVPELKELEGIRASTLALGFGHTVVVEKDTGRLFGFGDNLRGQVDGSTVSKCVGVPSTPEVLADKRVVDAATGLFHSAVVTDDGELVTFGCGQHGQSLSNLGSDPVSVGKWRPDDGCKVLRVACGRRHTVAFDEKGRIWTFGDNKYGQLGRSVKGSGDKTPGPVRIDWDSADWTIQSLCCGWSHTVVLARDSNDSTMVYGWGRNDKGQLGTTSKETVMSPKRLFQGHQIQSITCGSESTLVLDEDDDIWGCGWNEHGNLGTSNVLDVFTLSKVTGAPITLTPGYPGDDSRIAIAAGGAHTLAMKVAKD